MITHDQIPTTGRSSLYQAKQLGYSTIKELALALPKDAVILDIGAGNSSLGEDVLRFRADVSWINVDPAYGNSRNSQKNGVGFITDDITKPGSELTRLAGNVDVVYCYWLMPHLSLENDSLALTALQNMKHLLSEKGKLHIGPIKVKGFGLLSPYRYKGTLSYSNRDLTYKTLQELVEQTKLWWAPRAIQRFSNRHNIHLLKNLIGGKSEGWIN